MQLQQSCEHRAPWGRQSRAAGEAQHNRLPQGTAGLHGLSLPPATPAKALLALAQFVPGLSLWPELNSACAGHEHSDHRSLAVHTVSWQQDVVIGAQVVAGCPRGAAQCQAGTQQRELREQRDSPGQNKPSCPCHLRPRCASSGHLLLGQLFAVLELCIPQAPPCQGGMVQRGALQGRDFVSRGTGMAKDRSLLSALPQHWLRETRGAAERSVTS